MLELLGEIIECTREKFQINLVNFLWNDMQFNGFAKNSQGCEVLTVNDLLSYLKSSKRLRDQPCVNERNVRFSI